MQALINTYTKNCITIKNILYFRYLYPVASRSSLPASLSGSNIAEVSNSQIFLMIAAMTSNKQLFRVGSQVVAHGEVQTFPKITRLDEAISLFLFITFGSMLVVHSCAITGIGCSKKQS